jgi:hypothetical protein
MLAADPTTLEELAALLSRATTAREALGNAPEEAFRRYAKICHPDRFAPGPRQDQAAGVFRRLTAWLEVARKATTQDNEVLVSPRRSYVLIRPLAAGDLADVSLAEAEGRPYVLKITRPREGTPLLVGEARHLKNLQMRCEDRRYAEYLPKLVETFSLAGATGPRQVNVFASREGFHTLEAIRQRYPDGLDARHLAWIFKRMLAVLGFVHTCGLVHGAVLPPHVMVHAENHGLQLLDWIHAVPIGGPLTLIPTVYRSWYPREVLGREEVGPATDLFLAVQSLLYVAGGDPVAQRWPDTIPQEMQRFLGTCLYPSPRMRPQEAWDLHEEFDALLERLFGPPKYHQLVMT